MAFSRTQKFAHVYENGADFQNNVNGATLDTWTHPAGYMEAPQTDAEDKFPDLPQPQNSSKTLSPDPPPALLICRARRRHVTHDTSRTTLHGHAKFPVAHPQPPILEPIGRCLGDWLLSNCSRPPHIRPVRFKLSNIAIIEPFSMAAGMH